LVTKDGLNKIIAVYGKAWTTKNPNLILTIFTKNAKYHERAFEKPFIGHKQIKKYWEEKVVRGQSNIKFKLLKVYLVGSTAIAEWQASFHDNIKNRNLCIREIAVLELSGTKIKSLREYWHSKITG
jgi:hypothetical protein